MSTTSECHCLADVYTSMFKVNECGWRYQRRYMDLPSILTLVVINFGSFAFPHRPTQTATTKHWTLPIPSLARWRLSRTLVSLIYLVWFSTASRNLTCHSDRVPEFTLRLPRREIEETESHKFAQVQATQENLCGACKWDYVLASSRG